MKARIEPGYISGIISAPASKSVTQRVYAAALLHKGKTIIHGAGQCDDELAALRIIQQLGAKIVRHDAGKTEIISDGISPVTDAIHCGESGLAARLFAPIAATSGKLIKVEGAGSLLHRPMEGFEALFSALHVALPGFSGHLPFVIQGQLQAASLKTDAAGGSQLLSGLLFAMSSIATEPVTIEVSNLKSKPYIDLTLQVLAHFGKPVANHNYESFYIDPARFSKQETVETTIEGDWSSGACWLVAGAIAGVIAIRGLKPDSCQADKAVIDVLLAAGAQISDDDGVVSVKKSPLRAFDFDATHCPDLFPVLSVLAACCRGESNIKGIHRLFHKESNRAESISELLQNFDVPFSIDDDTLCVSGVTTLQGTVIDSFGDHRIVMAGAIGALRANGPVDIPEATAVNKSYPGFFNDLLGCGGKTVFTGQ